MGEGRPLFRTPLFLRPFPNLEHGQTQAKHRKRMFDGHTHGVGIVIEFDGQTQADSPLSRAST